MAKEMLINVSAGEECRIAVVEDGKLEELYMERTSSATHVGNVYKGKVTNVEASIQAAFIDFGIGRSGFATSYAGYAVPYGESRERFQECLDILRLAWTQETFSYSGEHFTFPARTVCVAAGTSPNVTYEREYPDTFQLDEEGEYFRGYQLGAEEPDGFALTPVTPSDDLGVPQHGLDENTQSQHVGSP